MIKKRSDDNYLATISDLMSGLMIIFLLIAIAYMHNVAEGQKKVKQIAVTYQKTQIELYQQLMEEFKNDLPRWKANIDKETLAIRFLEPEILFELGKAEINDNFKNILNDFFPRYLDIIFSEQFQNNIEEIRIEGHTSSEWGDGIVSKDEAYFNNMALSQERTRAVLLYCYNLLSVSHYKEKMKRYITANGLSSSQPIYDINGLEIKNLSRRVEFRTRTNAEQKIVQIIDELSHD